MSKQRLRSVPLRFMEPRREGMLEPGEVSAMVRLKELGWGAADCSGTRGQPEHGERLPGGGRVAAVAPAGARQEAERTRKLA